jgi:hypothetical protein
VRARGWALADKELAPGVRSVAAPVRDGTGAVRAAMNVTVHAAETWTERLLSEFLPLLLHTVGTIRGERRSGSPGHARRSLRSRLGHDGRYPCRQPAASLAAASIRAT